MDAREFRRNFLVLMDNRDNRYHPLVWIHGEPEIGEDVYIGGFSEINANGARVTIGEGCDIASFVAINVADSHQKCIGFSEEVDRKDIFIGDHVFIGSHSVILGGAKIGHHSVVGAGTVVGSGEIPPYSLVVGNPAVVRPGHYAKESEKDKPRTRTLV